MAGPVLRVADLRTHFHLRRGVVRAVDGVTLEVGRGRVLGLVGESGSGKSITGFSILGMVDPPGRIVGGSVRLNGQELLALSPAQMRRIRGNRIAMIFQDPMMTLNPVLRIETQIVEAVLAHNDVGRAEARARALAALERVSIPSARTRLRAYPHQFSGGMRQRVAIAIAMINQPDLIIADEPTTALDVTIQSQIVSEVQKVAEDLGTALVWITHDLSVVAGMADDIAVMYAGRIVEAGRTDDILDRPRHPYTRGLIDSIPAHNRGRSRLRQIPGMAPDPFRAPRGCAFADRCARASAACGTVPELTAFSPTHAARCHHPLPAGEPL